MLNKLVLLICLVALCSCNSSTVKDVVDIVDGVERKPIDTSITGVNAFANDSRFGSIGAQYLEVRDTLGLSFVRVLFAWNNAIQSSPGAAPDFSFYDAIIDGIPRGVDALVVVTGLPSWMSNSANWIDGNPRRTFVDLWLTPVLKRYGGQARIRGFQVWNEPNNPAFAENNVLDVLNDPENYVELLAFANSSFSSNAPGKAFVAGATTAINQNFPETLNYNRAMRDAGVQSLADVWAVHYYGKQFENVVIDGGVADFLNGLSLPIWVTESGQQGLSGQLAYVEEVWPFLKEKIPAIERFYYYQFTEASGSASTYGLRNLEGQSDLYNYLANR